MLTEDNCIDCGLYGGLCPIHSYRLRTPSKQERTPESSPSKDKVRDPPPTPPPAIPDPSVCIDCRLYGGRICPYHVQKSPKKPENEPPAPPPPIPDQGSCIDCRLYGGLCPYHVHRKNPGLPTIRRSKTKIQSNNLPPPPPEPPSPTSPLLDDSTASLSASRSLRTRLPSEDDDGYGYLTTSSSPSSPPLTSSPLSGRPSSLSGSARERGPPSRPPPAPIEEDLVEKDKMKKKRTRILQEILESEGSYLAQLQILEDLYMKPLRSDTTIIPLKSSDILFANISSIKDMNKSLFQDLEKKLREPEPCIGPIFLEFSPFLQMYQDYARFHSDAVELCQKLMIENSKFRLHCEKCANDSNAKGLNITSLLITPIQRVPRYKLLLLEVMKNTWYGHSDLVTLRQALNAIEHYAIEINKAIRSTKEGFLSKRGEVRKSWKKRWFVLSGGEMNYYTDKTKKESKGSFSVEGSRIVKISESVYTGEDRKGVFFAVTPYGQDSKRKYILEAVDEDERESWLQMLKVHGAVDDGAITAVASHKGSVKEGFVFKRDAGMLTTFKRRYFILLENQLQFFKSKPLTIDVAADDIYSISSHVVLLINEEDDTKGTELEFASGDQKIYIRFLEEADSIEWVQSLLLVINAHRRLHNVALAEREKKWNGQWEAAQSPEAKEGWLEKRGATNYSFQKRYWILDQPCLAYFKGKPKDKNSEKPLGVVTLTSDTVIQVDESTHSFAIQYCKDKTARRYVIRATNNKEMKSWIDSINEVVKYIRFAVKSAAIHQQEPIQELSIPSIRRSIPSSPTNPSSPPSSSTLTSFLSRAISTPGRPSLNLSGTTSVNGSSSSSASRPLSPEPLSPRSRSTMRPTSPGSTEQLSSSPMSQGSRPSLKGVLPGVSPGGGGGGGGGLSLDSSKRATLRAGLNLSLLNNSSSSAWSRSEPISPKSPTALPQSKSAGVNFSGVSFSTPSRTVAGGGGGGSGKSGPSSTVSSPTTTTTASSPINIPNSKSTPTFDKSISSPESNGPRKSRPSRSKSGAARDELPRDSGGKSPEPPRALSPIPSGKKNERPTSPSVNSSNSSATSPAPKRAPPVPPGFVIPPPPSTPPPPSPTSST